MRQLLSYCQLSYLVTTNRTKLANPVNLMTNLINLPARRSLGGGEANLFNLYNLYNYV